MWGLHGSKNGSTASVDVFLKQPSVLAAKKLLEAAHVSYDVVIEDLQKAIETENPPKEEIEQLQNRKGGLKFNNQIQSNACFNNLIIILIAS